MSFPPQQGPGPQIYSGGQQSNSGSGCLKAAGISCLVVVILTVAFLAFIVRTIKKSNVMSGITQQVKATSDGYLIYKAISQYRVKNGDYPPDLTSLVPDYLPDGKILHSPIDSVSSSPGHISWQYYKPTSSTAGDATLLDLPFKYPVTIGGMNVPDVQGDSIITVDGREKIVDDVARNDYDDRNKHNGRSGDMSASSTVDDLALTLSHRRPLPPLIPVAPFDPGLRPQIDSLPATALIRAILHLLNDDLTRGHPLVQQLEGDSTADYCHAIIHRREGDFANSKYWIRRTGPHAVLTEVYGNPTLAAGFVDEVQASGGTSPELEARQYDEMRRLLEYARTADG